ncbi:MAG: glutamine synthetase III [Alphaproteobacteria bacterium]|nr:glutamine synthetase III [Alphaproteobacteria bacterium]
MNQRLHALTNLANKFEEKTIENTTKITSIFAENVFTLKTAREYLNEVAYKSLKNSVNNGKKIDIESAGQIAVGMKSWAEEKGVTHYTHWFQPLTGTTAEKHDSFFTLKSDGSAIEEFDGAALIQQEPDASSFPSGGLRATFEARGYTAWDPSSPAFIIDNGFGKTLCIPTIFISYNGESLDYKAPLLKSIDFLNKAAVDVCSFFDKNVTKVIATLGWEQEYFVIDAGLCSARPDIIQCGRTVLGAAPAKGQQLEDFYFGSIPSRVYSFMLDFENEAYKLGIPLKTRHNEVAPGQYECAPIFEEVNLAVDHNLVLMDLMARIARRHNLKVLFHEKPFAGINGSGKHNNWSLATDTGINLLSPGKTPKSNLMFLTFFVNVIKAVHDYAEILRTSIASAGNDYRLGANEAPPAIISVFLGKYLSKLLKDLESKASNQLDDQDDTIHKLDIHKNIPLVILDNTDRNRTSPFAFTGNKFEFRAVGSSANCSYPMMVLNTIVAETLSKFYEEVNQKIEKGDKKELAILQTIQSYIKASKNVIFEGDGYSHNWHDEAEKRGLPNVKSTPAALEIMKRDSVKDLFSKHNILSHNELEARYEIELEKYIKKVQIEGRIMGDLCLNHVIPQAIKYQNIVLENVEGLKRLGIEHQEQIKLLEELSLNIGKVKNNVFNMVEARKSANHTENLTLKAQQYEDIKNTYFDVIRYHTDKLEGLVDDQLWDLPKYRELLLLR